MGKEDRRCHFPFRYGRSPLPPSPVPFFPIYDACSPPWTAFHHGPRTTKNGVAIPRGVRNVCSRSPCRIVLCRPPGQRSCVLHKRARTPRRIGHWRRACFLLPLFWEQTCRLAEGPAAGGPDEPRTAGRGQQAEGALSHGRMAARPVRGLGCHGQGWPSAVLRVCLRRSSYEKEPKEPSHRAGLDVIGQRPSARKPKTTKQKKPQRADRR